MRYFSFNIIDKNIISVSEVVFMTELEKIDKNFAIKKKIDKEDIKFYNVREDPFQIYGLYDPKNEPIFTRMPAEAAARVGGEERKENISKLAFHTAGGRVRFSTDSNYVAIRCYMDKIVMMSHMAFTGSSGFDIYMDDDGEGVFCGSYQPPCSMTNGFESIKEFKFTERKMRNYTIHFPLYNMVNELFIGLEDTANVGPGKEYRYETPVVIYGNSVTQGGCVCRPGNCYSNVISRKYDVDTVNLGFSGSARGEDEMIEYLASLDMSVFVCDYDHNAQTVPDLAATHPRVYRGIRDAHPDVPIIFISRPTFERPIEGMRRSVERREVIFKTYMDAFNSGDTNVYFIDGDFVFGADNVDACTVDLSHPNDMGHIRMAEVIGHRVAKFLHGSRYATI